VYRPELARESTGHDLHPIHTFKNREIIGGKSEQEIDHCLELVAGGHHLDNVRFCGQRKE